MRRLPGQRAFLAHAISSVDDQRLFGLEVQFQMHSVGNSLQLLLVCIERKPVHLPVTVPNSPFVEACSCKPWSSSIHAFRVIELATRNVTEREMCEKDLIRAPDG